MAKQFLELYTNLLEEREMERDMLWEEAYYDISVQDVKETLLENTWTKGYLVGDTEDGGIDMCLLGGVLLSGGIDKKNIQGYYPNRPNGGAIYFSASDTSYFPCTKYIAEAIKNLYPDWYDDQKRHAYSKSEEREIYGISEENYELDDYVVIFRFNDDSETDFNDVMEVLDEAIYLEKEEKVLAEMRQEGGS